MVNFKTELISNNTLLFIKHISKALIFCAMFIALISGAALCDEVPGTLDELAAAHQDAVLTLKAFRFNSSISCATETVHAISASGTFNSAGWSVYEAAIRINANPTASLDTKYFSNDGFYFRNFSIAHPEYPSPANTIEDWHEAPPEIFRREIPLDPMSISAAFIGNENAVVMARWPFNGWFHRHFPNTPTAYHAVRLHA